MCGMSLGQPETEMLSRSSGVGSKGVRRDAPRPASKARGREPPSAVLQWTLPRVYNNTFWSSLLRFREMLDNQLITLQSEEGARLKHLSCFSCKNFPGVAEGKFPFMRGLQLIKSENNRTRPWWFRNSSWDNAPGNDPWRQLGSQRDSQEVRTCDGLTHTRLRRMPVGRSRLEPNSRFAPFSAKLVAYCSLLSDSKRV